MLGRQLSHKLGRVQTLIPAGISLKNSMEPVSSFKIQFRKRHREQGELKITDDPEWTRLPDVVASLREREECNAYNCIAEARLRGVRAVGMAGRLTIRTQTTKLALAVVLALQAGAEQEPGLFCSLCQEAAALRRGRD